MSRTFKDSPNSRNNRPRRAGRQRNITVRGVRRDPPDLRKFSRALIQLALDEAASDGVRPKRSLKPAKPRPKQPPESADD